MNAFLWALLTAVIWGIAPILEKIGLHGRIDPTHGVIIRNLGVVLGLLLWFLFKMPPSQVLVGVETHTIFFLALGGFLASFVGQMAFYQSLKTGEVSRVVPVAGAYPLIAFLLSLMILGERLTLSKAIGVILIVLGTSLLK